MKRFLYILLILLSKTIFLFFWLTGSFNYSNDTFDNGFTLDILNDKKDVSNIVRVPILSTNNLGRLYKAYANTTFLHKQYYTLNNNNDNKVTVEYDGHDDYYISKDTLFIVNYTRKFGNTVSLSTLSEQSYNQTKIKQSLIKYTLFFISVNIIWIVLGYLYKKKYKNKGDLYFLYFSILLFSFYFIGDVIYIVKMYALL